MTEKQELEMSKKKVLRTAFEIRIVNTHNRVIKPRNIKWVRNVPKWGKRTSNFHNI
jgi:hypothetical protein